MAIYIIGGTHKKIHLLRHRGEVPCPLEKPTYNCC